jgi:hypothetical protein
MRILMPLSRARLWFHEREEIDPVSDRAAQRTAVPAVLAIAAPNVLIGTTFRADRPDCRAITSDKSSSRPVLRRPKGEEAPYLVAAARVFS